MGRKYVFLIALVLLFMVQSFGLRVNQVTTDASLEFPTTMPFVFVGPHNRSLFVGDTVRIAVKVFNLTNTYYSTNTQWLPGDEQLGPPGGILFTYSLGNLYGFDLWFSWNPNILQCISHQVRVPVDTYSDGILHGPILELRNDLDLVAGTYWLALCSWEGAGIFNCPDANSTVFTMTFEVISTGVSALSLDSFDLAASRSKGDTHSPVIPRVARSGGVFVTIAGDIDRDGDIDIYDITIAAGNYGENW